jgi:hypothetical protein
MKKLFLITAILVIALASVTRAQQQPSLKTTPSAKTAEHPTPLLLEIVSHPSFPPAYLSVSGPDEKPTWSWFARFIRLPGAPTEPAIRAVKLESKFNGETADVRVSLLRGAFDREDLVGVYQVGVGEQKTLNDLRAVGVEPFSIKLLNTLPPLPPPPAFENHTKSVEIVSVLSENTPKPAYRVTFRNLSEKNLLALRVDVNRDGRPGTSALVQGIEGRPAIEAGGIFERYMGVEIARPNPTGYVPDTAAANTIVIRTAVFADMSFEGESESACLFESFRMARRLWLRRGLALLNRELAKPTNENSIEAARQFKEKFAALEYEFDESDRNQASVVSPVCPKPYDVARTGTGGFKLQVLRELDEIIDTRPVPPVNFRLWLETHRAHYIAWLARLNSEL